TTLTHTHSHAHTHMHTHSHAHTHTHTLAHTHTYSHAHTDTLTITYSDSHTHMHAHPHAVPSSECIFKDELACGMFSLGGSCGNVSQSGEKGARGMDRIKEGKKENPDGWRFSHLSSGGGAVG